MSVNVFVSPLATLAFELCVVGDTELKTGWVRCRHGTEGGAVGWDGAGWGGTMVKIEWNSPVFPLLM